MKAFTCCILFLITLMPAGALDVARDLLDAVKDRDIVFENYVGPHIFYNTRDEIRTIGLDLSITLELEEDSESSYANKYLIFHRLADPEENLYSGDIFEITELSYIDNIRNIQEILSQYLMSLYGYNEEDSWLLARILLVYNAVYRGDIDYFSKTFSRHVVSLLRPEDSGIGLHYSQWPGRTQIVIPLSNGLTEGKRQNIESEVLIDDEVIEKIKESEEEGLELREEIVEYQEKEIDEIQEEIDTIEALVEEKEEIEEKLSDDIPEEPENGEDMVARLNALEEELEKAGGEEKAEELKETLQKKEDRVTELREDIARDKNRLAGKDEETPGASDLVFLLYKKDVDDMEVGEIRSYNKKSGTYYKRSALNSVRGDMMVETKTSVIVAAGGVRGNQGVRLMSVDKVSLDILVTGQNDIYPDGKLINYNKAVYGILQVDSKYYLGKFDENLVLQGQTQFEVRKNTDIIISDYGLCVQSSRNTVVWVNLSDLKTLSEL